MGTSLMTTDNYQGEESDITILSLTRSNSQGDIGFMSAPERLNVMITRARSCLIMIGNMSTFMSSKKGAKTWHPFFRVLKERKHLYDGFPIKCERHAETEAILSAPADFDRYCPDGGCAEPWYLSIEPSYSHLFVLLTRQCSGVQLPCGLHACKRRCHSMIGHSQVKCTEPMKKTCKRQHETTIPCCEVKSGCKKCLDEDLEAERRVKRDLDLERQRALRQAAYARELQEIQDEIEHERRTMKYAAEEETQKEQLQQQRRDLASLREAAERRRAMEQAKRTRELLARENAKKIDSEKTIKKSQQTSAQASELPDSAQAQWEFSKKCEGAKSKPLDELIGMIGLEDVKVQFLNIKTTVDTKVRCRSIMFMTNTKSICVCSFVKTSTSQSRDMAALFLEIQAQVRHFKCITRCGGPDAILYELKLIHNYLQARPRWQGYTRSFLHPWVSYPARNSRRPVAPSLQI